MLVYPLQWPSYGRLTWGDLRQLIFLIPGDTLRIDELNSELQFEGEAAPINSYLRDKAKALGVVYAKEMKGRLTSMSPDLPSLDVILDSITRAELQFLERYLEDSKLPQWFVDMERSEALYF